MTVNDSQVGLRVETNGATRILYLNGEVSIVTVGRLHPALLDALASAGNDLLNLAAIEGADLSGLQLLYSAAQSWQARGGQLTFEAEPEWLRTLAAEAGYPLIGILHKEAT